MSKNLILFASTTGYQLRAFAEAARNAGANVTLATDRCHRMDDPWGDQAIAVKFDRTGPSLEALRGLRFAGVLAVGDRPAILAAEAAVMFGLPFHTPTAARAGHDKHLARTLYHGKLRTPQFFEAKSPEDCEIAPYPCVLKPVGSSASRGVIRADNPAQFRSAFARILRMGEERIQVESYIPGREFAVEAIVTNGVFRPLAIFDKPDPLEGPFFEETIYTTPSRAPGSVQRDLVETAEQAARALGLRHGPVHAELRHNAEGAWILEAHARPIGGLCAQTIRFDGGMPLEEFIVRHALGEDVSRIEREERASGVMMIPTPRGGVYQSVSGVERARLVDGVEDVIVTAQEGQRLLPLPEGSSYLGFIFARADSAEEVEKALRRSHAQLDFEIATALETLKPSL